MCRHLRWVWAEPGGCWGRHTALRSSKKRCLLSNSGKGLWAAEKHACDLEERATGGWRERGPHGGGDLLPSPTETTGARPDTPLDTPPDTRPDTPPAPGQTPCRTPGQMPGWTPCQTAGRTPGPTPGRIPGWTRRRTPGRHAAAAVYVERQQQFRGRAERARSAERHSSALNHTSVHRPPGQRRNRGLCGSLGGPPGHSPGRSPAVSGQSQHPAQCFHRLCSARSRVYVTPPMAPHQRLLSSVTTLPPSTTWRRSPDVGGLLGEPADALSACHLPLVSGAPEVVKADREGPLTA